MHQRLFSSDAHSNHSKLLAPLVGHMTLRRANDDANVCMHFGAHSLFTTYTSAGLTDLYFNGRALPCLRSAARSAVVDARPWRGLPLHRAAFTCMGCGIDGSAMRRLAPCPLLWLHVGAACEAVLALPQVPVLGVSLGAVRTQACPTSRGDPEICICTWQRPDSCIPPSLQGCSLLAIPG